MTNQRRKQMYFTRNAIKHRHESKSGVWFGLIITIIFILLVVVGGMTGGK